MGKLLLLVLFAAPILCCLLGTPAESATYYRHPSGTAENKEAATGPCADASAAMSPSVYYSEEFVDGDIVWFCKTKKWIPGKFWSSRLLDVSTTIEIPPMPVTWQGVPATWQGGSVTW